MDTGRVYLIGFMGSGKSTVGRILAERLGAPFRDLDETVVGRAGRSIPEVFALEGETGFRALETEALKDLADGPATVIACGGGVVLSPVNRDVLRGSGTVVYLTVTADEALRRIGDPGSRPVLAAAPSEAEALLATRHPLYAGVADVVVDTAGRTPGQVVDTIIAGLEGARP